MFGVISPEGAGRKLSRYSWGSLGQIDDLARMPEIARRTLPWLEIDSRKVYAFGGSMGGQETLLLLARHPHLLAGAAAFDSVADFARQYRSFPRIPCDKALPEDMATARSARACSRSRARRLGGTPKHAARRVRGAQPGDLRRARSPPRACRCSSGGAPPTGSSSTRRQQSGALFRADQGS